MEKRRIAHRAKLNQYILIGGWSFSNPYPGEKMIVLYEGNCTGERLVRVLHRFSSGATYSEVKEKAESLSSEMGIVLGRNFSKDDWNGPEES